VTGRVSGGRGTSSCSVTGWGSPLSQRGGPLRLHQGQAVAVRPLGLRACGAIEKEHTRGDLGAGGTRRRCKSRGSWTCYFWLFNRFAHSAGLDMAESVYVVWPVVVGLAVAASLPWVVAAPEKTVGGKSSWSMLSTDFNHKLIEDVRLFGLALPPSWEGSLRVCRVARFAQGHRAGHDTARIEQTRRHTYANTCAEVLPPIASKDAQAQWQVNPHTLTRDRIRRHAQARAHEHTHTHTRQGKSKHTTNKTILARNQTRKR
jgi:hypothetical protein